MSTIEEVRGVVPIARLQTQTLVFAYRARWPNRGLVTDRTGINLRRFYKCIGSIRCARVSIGNPCKFSTAQVRIVVFDMLIYCRISGKRDCFSNGDVAGRFIIPARTRISQQFLVASRGEVKC